MSAVDVRTPAGKASGSVELPAEIFEVQVNIPLIHQVVVAHARSLRELADLMGMIKGTHSPYSREPSISPGDTISLSESASRPYYGMHPGSTWLLESVSGGTATLRRLRSDGRRLPQGKELRVKLKDLESLLQVHMDAKPILKVERGVKETP